MLIPSLIHDSDFQLLDVTQQDLNPWLGILRTIQDRPVKALEFMFFFIQMISHALQIRAWLPKWIAPAGTREFEEIIVFKLYSWPLIAIGITNAASLDLHDVALEDSHCTLQLNQTRAPF